GVALDLYRQASAAAAEADARGREASSHLADYLRLASVVRLADLEQRARELWPAPDERVAAYDAWLAEARELTAGTASLAAGLADARARAAGETDAGRVAAGRFLVETLERHLAELERFAGEQGTAADVAGRRAWAAVVRQRSIDEHAEAWRDAIEAIG